MSAVIPIKEVEYEHPLPGNTCDTKHAWARVPAEPAPAERAALKEKILGRAKEFEASSKGLYETAQGVRTKIAEKAEQAREAGKRRDFKVE